MIRSKGVGVFFCTQMPKDVHRDVLAQLGNRVQHALRAFTPEDAKALKAAVSTYPSSDFYDLEELLPVARDRRGGRDDPVRARRPHPGRSQPYAGARVAHGRRRTTSMPSPEASRAVRRSTGPARIATAPGSVLAARLEKPAAPTKAPKPTAEHTAAREGHEGGRRRARRTSSPRVRARPSSARSSAASSEC